MWSRATRSTASRSLAGPTPGRPVRAGRRRATTRGPQVPTRSSIPASVRVAAPTGRWAHRRLRDPGPASPQAPVRAARGLAARPAGRRTSSARRTWSSRPRVGRRAAERTPMAAPRPPSRPPQATPQAPPEASSATGRVPTRPTEARRRSPQVPAAPRIHPLRDAASSHSPRPATSRATPASRPRSGGSSGPPSGAPRPPARVGSRAIRRGPPGRAPGSARPQVPGTTRPPVPRRRPRSRGSPAGERHRSASRARPGRAAATSASTVAGDARAAPIWTPPTDIASRASSQLEEADGEDHVDDRQQGALEPVRLAIERDQRR